MKIDEHLFTYDRIKKEESGIIKYALDTPKALIDEEFQKLECIAKFCGKASGYPAIFFIRKIK